MRTKVRIWNAASALTVLVSMNLQGLPPVYSQDLVAKDDIASGASVFVFRGSRKKPQEAGGGGASGGGARAGGSISRSYRERLNSQIAANRKKKADQAKAQQALIAKRRAAERNAKLKQSNVFTARGEALMASGDVTGATSAFRDALKANPKNADAALGLSDALTVKGSEVAGDKMNDAALPYLEEAVKVNPRNGIAFAKLGEIHAARGRNPQAIASYEKALAADPELSSLYAPLGLAYIEAGEIAKAETFLAKAEQAGAGSSDTKIARGRILLKQNKNAEALAVFNQIIEAEPQNAGAVYQTAVTYGRLEQPDRAVDAYKRTVQIDPTYSAAWFDLGVYYYNRGDYNNALAAYKEAVRVDPSNGQAHANLASTFRQLERYPDANAEYALAEANGIKTPDLYSEWGFCLGQTGAWDKSVARLETARTSGSTAIDDTNVGWGYYNAAQAEKAANNEAASKANLEKGKSSLQAAVQKDPNLDAAYLNLGSTYNGLGEHQNAVTALDKANALHKDWGIALNQLGLAHRGLGNLAVAIQVFDRVVNLDGNSVVGLFNLGSAQYANGDKSGAKKTQGRLKKINPALADTLGNIIAGKIIDAGTKQIKKSIPVPGGFPRPF